MAVMRAVSPSMKTNASPSSPDWGRDERLAFQDAAEAVDLGGGPMGEIGECAFHDLAAGASSFAKEERTAARLVNAHARGPVISSFMRKG